MPFTSMQSDYFKLATHRWNVKSGATRSGKTYMDCFLIPKRIRAVAHQPGLTLLMGNTKGTLERNIIEPLQSIWGVKFVSSIKSDNTADLFGERVYCLGADKADQVDKLRGSSIKYCYGDEVVTWHPEVFNMLKSRLDKPYSCFDGTCNPEGRHHWFKKFLDSNADIYLQQYTIDDNPYLSAEFVKNLKCEYAGTIYYDRYIRGLWVNAEGVIYRAFNDRQEDFIIDSIDGLDIIFATIGVDFGGGTSAHAFNCTGFTRGLKQIVTIADYRRKDAATPQQLYSDFCDFVSTCRLISNGKFVIADVYCDSAEQTLIGGLKAEAIHNDLRLNIYNAKKLPIKDRIRFYTGMMGSNRYKILRNCSSTIEAFSTAMWNDKILTEDVRLDNGTTNIDNLDAQEYTTERLMKDIIERG